MTFWSLAASERSRGGVWQVCSPTMCRVRTMLLAFALSACRSPARLERPKAADTLAPSAPSAASPNEENPSDPDDTEPDLSPEASEESPDDAAPSAPPPNTPA